MGIEKENKFRIKVLIEEVERYKSEGNLLHAYQICISIISEFDDYFDAYITFAEVCETMGNINPAIEAIDIFIKEHDNDHRAIMFLGKFLLQNSRWDEAINSLSLVLPEDIPEVSFLIGYAHFMLEEFQHAALHFKRYIKLIKTNLNVDSIFLLIKSQIQLKEFEDALKLLKKYEKTFFFDDTFNFLCSIVYYNLKMVEHAVTHIERTLAIRPKDIQINQWAGKIYLSSGNLIKAEKFLVDLVNQSEEIPSEACYLLAEVYLQQNKIDEALKYYDLAVKLEPKKRRIIEPLEKAILQKKNRNSNE